MTKKIILLVLITLALSSALFLKLGFSRAWFVSYLSMNKPLSAEMMVVEGWVSQPTVQLAAREFEDKNYSYILCSGSPTSPYYLLSENGFLEFGFSDRPLSLQKNDTLSFLLKGSPVQGIFPEYMITINDHAFSRGLVKGIGEYYSLILDTIIQAQTINIHFLNDTHHMGEDRNLEVKSLRINNREYPARSDGVSHYEHNDPQRLNPRSTNFTSVAEFCAMKLREEGVPDNLIRVVPSAVSTRNRTLASAIVISNYLENQDLPQSQITIISEGIHARRTWLAYRFAFRKQNTKVGIISVPQFRNDSPATYDIKEILKELSSIFYYKFFFNKSNYRKQLIQDSHPNSNPS